MANKGTVLLIIWHNKIYWCAQENDQGLKPFPALIGPLGGFRLVREYLQDFFLQLRGLYTLQQYEPNWPTTQGQVEAKFQEQAQSALKGLLYYCKQSSPLPFSWPSPEMTKVLAFTAAWTLGDSK